MIITLQLQEFLLPPRLGDQLDTWGVLFLTHKMPPSQDYKEMFANDWTVEENRQEIRRVQCVSTPKTVWKWLCSFGVQEDSDASSDWTLSSILMETVQFVRHVQRFTRNCCVRLQGRRDYSILKIEAVDLWNVSTYLSNYRVSDPRRQ